MIEEDLQSRVLIYARPSAMDVFPYNIPVLKNSLSADQIKTPVIRGKSFMYDVRNVYLSTSNESIFSGLNPELFNPFASNPKLYFKNPEFRAIQLSAFTVFNETILYFDIPDQIFINIENQSKSITFLDVIIENEAGYGLLSRDSYSYRVCSWSGFTQEQKPCISGIKLTFN